MRLGLLGESGGDLGVLREGLEFLLDELSTEEVVYLGHDGENLAEVIDHWSEEVYGGPGTDVAFLKRAHSVAGSGDSAAIRTLLEAERWRRQLSTVRMLAPHPSRTVEHLGGRFLLMVHDKSILDEEDIANAQVVVYGKSEEASLRRFGKRYFVTPGPLSAGRVVLIEEEEPSQVSIAIFELTGVPVLREVLAGRTSKVRVS